MSESYGENHVGYSSRPLRACTPRVSEIAGGQSKHPSGRKCSGRTITFTSGRMLQLPHGETALQGLRTNLVTNSPSLNTTQSPAVRDSKAQNLDMRYEWHIPPQFFLYIHQRRQSTTIATRKNIHKRLTTPSCRKHAQRNPPQNSQSEKSPPSHPKIHSRGKKTTLSTPSPPHRPSPPSSYSPASSPAHRATCCWRPTPRASCACECRR